MELELELELELADKTIAEALGYPNPAVIRLIKANQMKLPIYKAFALAQALEFEPGVVMQLLLSETAPKVLRSIEECMGPLALRPGENGCSPRCASPLMGELAPVFFEGTPIVAVIVG